MTWSSRRGPAETFEYEHRLLMPGGSVKHVHMQAHATRDKDGLLEYIARSSGCDTAPTCRRKLSPGQDRNLRRWPGHEPRSADRVHRARSQPTSLGNSTNASTCLRMLSADPPNIDGARETVRRTIRDGNRASDVITRLRTLYSKKEPCA